MEEFCAQRAALWSTGGYRCTNRPCAGLLPHPALCHTPPMDIDYSSLFGAGFLLAIVIPVLVGLIGLFITYWVIRSAVRGGMRDHFNWVEKNAARALAPTDPTP